MIDILKPVLEQFAFNGSLFALAFDDVTNEESRIPPSDDAATLNWLGGHLVTSRYHVLQLLGHKQEIPWQGRYERAVDPVEQESVTIERIVGAWDLVTPRMLSAMATADKRKLQTAPSSPFPTIEQSTLAALAFMANHEAYHIGQLSYVRRCLGKPPLVEQLLTR